MNRKLKTLGLALVAVLAMGISAASASAANFHSESTSTVLTATQVNQHTFTSNAGTVHCTTATFSGTTSSTSTTQTSQELTPAYSGCTNTTFGGATVDVGTCKYRLHAAGTADVTGCGVNGLRVTAPGCTITVPDQTGLSKVSYATGGTGTTHDLLAEIAIIGIKYTQSGFLCSSGTFTNGTLTGTATVTGEKNGAHVGITWSA
jgi:hypothetical protein